ncbi:tetraspanin-7-like [Dreissena polymorpha]|nr:tetraspanin-7-like [Dreissena polymorpha]
MDCCGCLASFGLISFNLIFMLSGIAVLGVGIWARVNKDIVNMQHIVTLDSGDNALKTASTVLIIFGVVVLLFAAFGFFAACLPKRCSGGKKFFGGLYIFFLSLVLIGELSGGITAAVFKKKIDDQLPDILKKTLSTHYKPGNNLQAKAWDYVQVWLTCCGSKEGPLDYIGTNFTSSDKYVPDTCCVLTNNNPDQPNPKNSTACQLEAGQIQSKLNLTTTSDFVKTEGCYTSFESQIKSHVILLIGVGVGIAMLEFLGIVLACIVCRRGDKDD